jgi:hypothetical protein
MRPIIKISTKYEKVSLTPEYPHSRTGTSGGIGTSIKKFAADLSGRLFRSGFGLAAQKFREGISL